MIDKRRRSLTAYAAITRLLSSTLEHWKLALFVAFFLSPVGPHLRTSYSYSETYGQVSYTACTYLGSRGFVRLGLGAECPVIAFLDTRDWKR